MLRVTDSDGHITTDTAVVEVPSSTSPGLTFAPDADARVEEEFATSNFGASSRLEIDGGSDLDTESYLRFTVSGLGGPVQQALLRVYADDSSTDDGTAVYTTTTGWVENTITWANRPARGSGALDTVQELDSDTWVEYDVTAAIMGNGSYAFVLAALSDDGVDLSSREGDFPPQLVVSVGSGGPTATATSTPTRQAVAHVSRISLSSMAAWSTPAAASIAPAAPSRLRPPPRSRAATPRGSLTPPCPISRSSSLPAAMCMSACISA
jgi:hypothetical protein